MTTSPGRPVAGAAPVSRCSSARRKAYTALLATAVVLPAAAIPALAAVTPVEFPRGITLFPERDFLGVEGFSSDAPVTINVYRDDVKIGTAHGTPLPDAETGTLLEVNHPGGVCWSGVTPDLLPGDRVEVIEEDTGDAATTVGEFSNLMDVTAEAAIASDLDGDGSKDDIVVHGTASNPDGTKMTESLMEQRIVAPDLKEIPSIDRRDIRALFTGGIADGVPSTGDIAWDDPTDPLDTHWTATYTDIGADVVAVATAGQTRVLAWERTDAIDNRIGMTIYEEDEVGGPGFGGCPAGASDGVTGTTPANVNIAAVAAGGNLVVNGTSFGATSVDVVLDDHDADTTDQLTVTATPNNPPSADPAVPLTLRAQTWRASLPMAQLAAAGIAPGELTVSGTFHRMTERTELQKQDTDLDPATPDVDVPVLVRETRPIGGAEHTLLKDLVAPLSPLVTPPGGSYFGTQTVNAEAVDQGEDTVRYRLGQADVPAPTAASAAVTGQLVVSDSQTLKTRSFDRAGNPSPIITSTYVISQAGVPGQPVLGTATPGNGQMILRWSAAAPNGSAVSGYVLRAYEEGDQDFPVAEVNVANVLSGTVPDLVNGAGYTFTVSGMNGVGEGIASDHSAVLRPVAPPRAPFSPTIGTATAINGAANLTWTPPSFNGGSAVTGYRVTAFNSATGAQVGAVRTAAATATNLQIAGLLNGTPYDFEVRAVNALGTGDPSDRSNTVVPAGLPGAPTAAIAEAGDASAYISWVEPVNTGGVEVNSYRVQVRTGTTVVRTVEVFDVEAEIFSLTNGTAYNFRVQAVNSAGAGALSTATAAVTPRAAAPVNPAPTVTAQTPANGSTGAAVGVNTTATFSEPVTGVSAAKFTLTAPNGTVVAAPVTLNAAGTVATLNPNANLVANTLYTARLAAGITDTAGAALAPTSWTFTTAAGANVAPTVTGRAPAPNSTNAGTGANVNATFSEAVTGVTTATYQLRNTTTGAVVAATVTADPNVANRWVLDPSASLARNTQYTVTLTGGATAIRDLAGAPLANVTWVFRTVV